MVCDLPRAQRLDGVSALKTVTRANTRVEQTQIVKHLSHSAHGRSRVVANSFLLDGDSWAETAYEINLWFLDLIQEVADKRRQAFYETSLCFGIDRVNRQRGFATTTDASKHHQFVPWNGNINVLEIMLSSATDLDFVRRYAGHCRLTLEQEVSTANMRPTLALSLS